jgi:hypothetical protein
MTERAMKGREASKTHGATPASFIPPSERRTRSKTAMRDSDSAREEIRAQNTVIQEKDVLISQLLWIGTEDTFQPCKL